MWEGACETHCQAMHACTARATGGEGRFARTQDIGKAELIGGDDEVLELVGGHAQRLRCTAVREPDQRLDAGLCQRWVERDRLVGPLFECAREGTRKKGRCRREHHAADREGAVANDYSPVAQLLALEKVQCLAPAAVHQSSQARVGHGERLPRAARRGVACIGCCRCRGRRARARLLARRRHRCARVSFRAARSPFASLLRRTHSLAVSILVVSTRCFHSIVTPHFEITKVLRVVRREGERNSCCFCRRTSNKVTKNVFALLN